MSNYIGKICPYCKTEIKAGDDVVICSECEMPHHKDCWIENQGCTTFGCLGTIQTPAGAAVQPTYTPPVAQPQPVYTPPAAPQPTYTPPVAQPQPVYTPPVAPQPTYTPPARQAAFCPNCGAQHTGENPFCAQCGYRLTPAAPARPAPQPTYQQPAYQQQQPAYQPPAYQQQSYQQSYSSFQSNPVDDIVVQLIDTKTEYYVPKFNEMRSQSKSTSWNWPAFLITPYWMLYRKMYGYGVAYLLVDLLLGLMGLNLGVAWTIVLIARTCFGIFGNSIYMKYLEKKADEIRLMQEPYRSHNIHGRKGVSVPAAVIAYFIEMILIALLS